MLGGRATLVRAAAHRLAALQHCDICAATPADVVEAAIGVPAIDRLSTRRIVVGGVAVDASVCWGGARVEQCCITVETECAALGGKPVGVDAW